MDQNGHGTFVAGVVGAVGNNALVCLLVGVHLRKFVHDSRWLFCCTNCKMFDRKLSEVLLQQTSQGGQRPRS